jgi:hypothetical protein
VTTHAPLRSRWTKAASVYHVRERVTGILSHLLVKIQGWTLSNAPPPEHASCGRAELVFHPSSGGESVPDAPAMTPSQRSRPTVHTLQHLFCLLGPGLARIDGD